MPMTLLGTRWLGALDLFAPAAGVTVREPPGQGEGYWAGAPSVIRDRDGRFWLSYRLRRPRDQGRGYESRIATSDDGVHFTDAWAVRREELGSASIERCCLLEAGPGDFRLYLSYVDPADQRWRIDLVTAAAPDRFTVAERAAVLTAADIGGEAVKDPYVLRVGPGFWLFASYAPPPAAPAADLHAGADAFVTGLVRSHTGLATSADGRRFAWQGDVLSPAAAGWDQLCSRLASVVWVPPVFVAFWDGSATVAENFEQRTGLAVTCDLVHFTKFPGPSLVSPNGSGSLRYLDALPVGDEFFCYYEYAGPDGSHELRLSRLPRPAA